MYKDHLGIRFFFSSTMLICNIFLSTWLMWYRFNITVNAEMNKKKQGYFTTYTSIYVIHRC